MDGIRSFLVGIANILILLFLAAGLIVGHTVGENIGRFSGSGPSAGLIGAVVGFLICAVGSSLLATFLDIRSILKTISSQIEQAGQKS